MRALLAASAVLSAACMDRPAPKPLSDEERTELETRVTELRHELAARLSEDSLLTWLEGEEGEILIGLRTDLLQDVAGWAVRGYLNDVRLHIAPDVPVQETEEVKVKIGPISVNAGHWYLRVTIRQVLATLRTESIELAVADSSRMSAVIDVAVEEASGDADIHFRWDAATVASVVCRDFEMSGRFGGTVAPFHYELVGAFRFESSPDGILTVPEFGRPRMRVRPRPTRESWSRVGAILDEQNNIFRCGLALEPDEMMEKLERLLGQGFEFTLPEVIFRPIHLPARVEDRVVLHDRPVDIRNVPAHLHMTGDAIWYGSMLDVGSLTETASPVTEAASPSTEAASPSTETASRARENASSER